MITFAVVTFPGSNCDRDCHYVLRDVLGYEVREVFHKEKSLGKCDAVILPGGFSYGDYLRAGALAKFSPIMPDVRRFAEAGGPVLGICNGFQILCETGLLPGALVRNRNLRFISRVVSLEVVRADTIFTSEYAEGQQIEMPIAHGEGNYVADAETIRRIEAENRVVLRYALPVRTDAPDGNPNGSTNSIAGIINEKGNVMGLMPYPERASDPAIVRPDGAGIFLAMANALQTRPSLVETA